VVNLEQNPREKSIYKGLLVLCIALFLIQRGGLLWYGLPNIYHPSLDEPTSGTLAFDLLNEGLRATLFTYQYFEHTGDVLLEGLSLVPLYKIFGCSLFSMKLFALLVSLLAMLLWIVLIKKYWGIRAAIIFSALFALPPPTFARLNLVGTLSSHHILNPILAAQLLLLFRFQERQRSCKPYLCVFWFGFFAGLGTYTFYSYIIFNVFCIAFLLLACRSFFRPKNLIIFSFGTLAGFSPWIVRCFYSLEGALFLKSLLGGSGEKKDVWNIVVTFLFNLPHSLSYTYPERTIGVTAVLFVACTFFCLLLITHHALREWVISRNKLCGEQRCRFPLSILFGLFVVFFILFFLMAVSLSSKQIFPFEYWNNIGLFGTFAPVDCIRYRWFHFLYPFYFTTVAIGTDIIVRQLPRRRLCSAGLLAVVTFFIVLSAVKTLQMCNRENFPAAFAYKGYNFDTMATAFILRSMAPRHLEAAETIADRYPEENKSAIYQALGTKFVLKLLSISAPATDLSSYCARVPDIYRNDFIFGVVRTAQLVPEKKLIPFFAAVQQGWPELFYENWGFRQLAFKYYGTFLNYKKLLKNIPPAEQWFYKKFIDKFKKTILAGDRQEQKSKLAEEILAVPVEYRKNVVFGLGKFIGSEMLFDPLTEPDYPLEGGFDLSVPHKLSLSFYRGMGAGIAETLCRFWRCIMPPSCLGEQKYTAMLEREWQRCHRLMDKLPQQNIVLIKTGFTAGLRKCYSNNCVKTFLHKQQ